MKRQTSQIEKNQQDGDVERQQLDDVAGGNMFSKALLNLSLNERNMIEEEIHGVSCMDIDETPELIEESLYQFDLELDLIENKAAYNKAKAIIFSKEEDHSYCLSKANKLRFLRTEFFDPRKSASRYTRYLDLLFEIYGEFALRRPIRMQDFNREELAFLKSGQYQLLPYRDRGGRRIMAIVSDQRMHVTRRGLLKVFLYFFFASGGGCDYTSNNDRTNVGAQSNGGIIVVAFSAQLNHSNETDNQNKKLNFNLAQWRKERLEANALIATVAPLRIAAIHVCLPNSNKFKLLASVYGIALKVWNARTKIHLGNPIEIRYKLQQYGIPIELIPSTDTGTIKSVNLKQWIKLRTHLEHNVGKYDSAVVSTTNNIVECPLSNDVIFRRGKTMNVHSGNVKFQNLIESHIYEHSIDLNTPPLRRAEIEIELMNEVQIHKQGVSGRFLTWNIEKKWWSIIHSEDEIQSKIHYAFRDFRRKMLKKQQHQQKVRTVTNLNSLFEGQQDGQKKTYNNNKNSCSDYGLHCGGSDDNNNVCNITPCLLPISTKINSENDNNNACGHFFSTEDGSYAYLDDTVMDYHHFQSK